MGNRRARKPVERIGPSRSPCKHVTDISGLTLAHNEFLAIVQSNEPSLTGHHTHFSYLLDIDYSISMNSPESSVIEVRLNAPQVLCGSVALLRR